MNDNNLLLRRTRLNGSFPDTVEAVGNLLADFEMTVLLK